MALPGCPGRASLSRLPSSGDLVCWLLLLVFLVFPSEKLRKVSPLGLRILAESPVLSTLQNTNMHDRPIVIEGWLRPKAGVLKVRSVQPATVSED